MLPFLKKQIDEAPATTGVYLFFKEKTPIYIGKSIHIKARLKSHLENAKIDPKEQAIFDQATAIKIIPTENEFTALLLEAQLIKKHAPHYNVIWRDGKSHLYIKINKKEEYPKITLCRKENDGKSVYFGPFAGVRIAEIILREIRKVVPYCTQKKITKHPCFYSKIGMCNPCPSAIEQQKDKEKKKFEKKIYQKNIKTIITILQGKTDRVLKKMEKEMEFFSKKEKFEEALSVRNRIFNFQKLISERLDFNNTNGTFYRADPTAGIRILHTYLTQFFPTIPSLNRIECLDISNTSQREITGGLVVATNGTPDKQQYRKFKIKNRKVNSDFSAIEEVLRRRFARTDWEKPNLFLIDGGSPQVRQVLKVFSEMNIAIPVVGIAKNPDRLVIGNSSLETKRMALNNPAFNVIRNIRDEAHRFSKKYHAFLRDKKVQK